MRILTTRIQFEREYGSQILDIARQLLSSVHREMPERNTGNGYSIWNDRLRTIRFNCKNNYKLINSEFHV